MRLIHLPFVCPVSGVSFRQEVVAGVVEGDEIDIVANPDNPHDAKACEVRHRGELVGFVPAALAARLHERGETRWAGQVREVLRRETWGLRIEVTAPIVEDSADNAGPGDDDDSGGATAAAPATVRARSGRVLGTLVRITDDHVVVDHDGTETSYPANLVTIGDAAA